MDASDFIKAAERRIGERRWALLDPVDRFNHASLEVLKVPLLPEQKTKVISLLAQALAPIEGAPLQAASGGIADSYFERVVRIR